MKRRLLCALLSLVLLLSVLPGFAVNAHAASRPVIETDDNDNRPFIIPNSADYIGMKIIEGTSHLGSFKVARLSWDYDYVYWYVGVYGGVSTDDSNINNNNRYQYWYNYASFEENQLTQDWNCLDMFENLSVGDYTLFCYAEYYYNDEWHSGRSLSIPFQVIKDTCGGKHNWTNRVVDTDYDPYFDVHYTCSKCGAMKCAEEVRAYVITDPVDVTVNAGSTATFSVEAIGDAPVSYRWYQKKVGGDWEKMSGETSSTLSVTAYANRSGRQYRCVVTNALGSSTSAPATLIVITAPTITSQPKAITVNAGATATFTVAASGTAPLSYQWYQKKVGGNWEKLYGETSATLTQIAYANREGRQYRCVVSNSAGSVTSDAATLHVNAQPVITKQPQDVHVLPTETAAFTVAATGYNLSYQWYQKKVGGNWEKMSGETSATLTQIAYANRDGRQYRCVVSNAYGSVTSAAATMHVNAHIGCPCANFVDMPAYGTPEHEAIDWAYVNGITAGLDDKHFGTGETLTRAQTATFLYAAEGRPPFDVNSAGNPFSDVPAGKWFTTAVLWAADVGIVAGYADGTFQPNTTLTRGQILVILYAEAGRPSIMISNPYSDVPAGKWYTNAALWAYQAGIERGDNGVFAQDTPCTRASFVLYLYRYMTGNCLLTD